MVHLLSLLLLSVQSGFLDFKTWVNRDAVLDTSRQHRIVVVVDDTIEAPEAVLSAGYGRVWEGEDRRLQRVRTEFLVRLKTELRKRFDTVVVLDSVATPDLDRRIEILDRVSKKSVLEARILSDSSRFRSSVEGQLVLYVNKLKFSQENVRNSSIWHSLLGTTLSTPDMVPQLVLFSRFVLWDHRENRHVVGGKGDEEVESRGVVTSREWDKCLTGMTDNVAGSIPAKKLKRKK